MSITIDTLFRDAMLTDLKPHEFWNLTIREFYIYKECYEIKRKEQMDYDLAIAWKTAFYQRVPKFPTLKEVLGQTEVVKAAEPQSEQEMFSKMKNFNMMRGGEVI